MMGRPFAWERIRGVLRDERGAAMLEMVFILPVAILLYLSILYFSDFSMAQNRVSAAADAMATAAARESCLKDNDTVRAAILTAAKALLPQTTQVEEMVLTSVAPVTDADGNKTGWQVQWSYANPGSAAAEGASVTFSGGSATAFAVAKWDKPVLTARIKVKYASPIAGYFRMLPSMSEETPGSWLQWSADEVMPYINVSAQQMEWESAVPAFSADASCS